MKNKKLGGRGMAWSLSKITVLLGALMLFMILWSFYKGFVEINATDSGIREAINMARVIDEIGSSPSYCETRYESPKVLSGNGYGFTIVPGRVTILMNGTGRNSSARFISELGDNLSAPGGYELRIRKDGNLVEVS
jgi:hypothetical protein